MVKEGDLYPNGKLFDKKLEEKNGGLVGKKIALQKGLGGHQEMRRQERKYFEDKESKRWVSGDLGNMGQGRRWSG